MIGNDIVDLSLASKESDWQRPRFLQKLFTASEQAFIYDAAHTRSMLWRLWSMKESAYKVQVQQYGKRFFAPKKFVCCSIDTTEAIVRYEDTVYKTTTSKTEDYIFSTASPVGSKTKASHTCFMSKCSSGQEQSKEVYHKLKKLLAIEYQLPYEAFYIKKTVVGVPELFLNSRKLELPFSITHHGRFAAISILKAS